MSTRSEKGLTRRDFAKSTALAAGLGILSSKTSVAQNNSDALKIAYLASLGFGAMPAAEVVDHLSELGYAGVEWTLAHFNPRVHDAAALRHVVEVTHSANMVPTELVVQQDYVHTDDALREDRVALTLECIEACAEHGITTVNLFTGPAPWDRNAPVVGRDISEGAAWDMVWDAFGRIVPALQQHNVKGAVEGVWGHLCNDYYTTLPLIEGFDTPLLGVNFDPSHDVLKGNWDMDWIVRQWGADRIMHIHLKDAVGIPEEGKFLFPFIGEGNVDWKAMFDALRDIGWDGYCSVEFESFTYHNKVLKGDTVEAARRCMQDVCAVMAL